MRIFVRGAGELLLSAGVIVLLFVAYLIWGTALRANGAQHNLASQLNQRFAAADPACPASGSPRPATHETYQLTTGQPFAFIRIPVFGQSWKYTLVQGTSLAQLDVSPGHVPGTQLPGQVGNFAVAGHRVTAGNPFFLLPSLKKGDRVYIETVKNVYTYRVTGEKQVLPSDVAVLDADPGQPGQQPKNRMITLITCNPAWTGTHRVIVTGHLISAHARCGR